MSLDEFVHDKFKLPGTVMVRADLLTALELEIARASGNVLKLDDGLQLVALPVQAMWLLQRACDTPQLSLATPR